MDGNGDAYVRGADIIAALKEAGVGHVAALPDITTSAGLLWPLSEDSDLRLIRLCKEDEGVSICAGLAFCDQRAVLLMQQTGFLDSINSIRAIGVEYSQPLCMLIGLLGKEPDKAPRDSARYGVRTSNPFSTPWGSIISASRTQPTSPASRPRSIAPTRLRVRSPR